MILPRGLASQLLLLLLLKPVSPPLTPPIHLLLKRPKLLDINPLWPSRTLNEVAVADPTNHLLLQVMLQRPSMSIHRKPLRLHEAAEESERKFIFGTRLSNLVTGKDFDQLIVLLLLWLLVPPSGQKSRSHRGGLERSLVPFPSTCPKLRL